MAVNSGSLFLQRCQLAAKARRAAAAQVHNNGSENVREATESDIRQRQHTGSSGSGMGNANDGHTMRARKRQRLLRKADGNVQGGCGNHEASEKGVDGLWN